MPSSYLLPVFRDFDKVVKDTVETIRRESIGQFTFDAVVVRGVSGLLVGPSVASVLGKPLIVVRKAGEISHGISVEYNESLECFQHSFNYIIIDDLIATGETIKSIVFKLSTEFWYPVNCKAIFLYSSASDSEKTEQKLIDRILPEKQIKVFSNSI